MQKIQFRDYFEARALYLQTEGIAEPTSSLEKLPFLELRTLLNEIDIKTEKEMPDYWQKMYDWYANWGNESSNRKFRSAAIMEPQEWSKVTPKERAKGTLQMLERYFASKIQE